MLKALLVLCMLSAIAGYAQAVSPQAPPSEEYRTPQEGESGSQWWQGAQEQCPHVPSCVTHLLWRQNTAAGNGWE